MRNEELGTRGDGRGTRDEGQKVVASVVPVSEASGRLSSLGLVLIALLLLLPACGYHFTPVGGIVPESAKTIAIPVFINGTYEPLIDTEVTRAVVDEFLADGRLQVVGLEAADVVLKGTVTKFEITPTSYTADTFVQSYNISIGVNITIEDAKAHKVLLKDSGVGSVFNSSYAVFIGDITRTKIAKDAAVKNACKDLASTLRSRVLEGF
jgi:outer membrane lipopolysaccharide assembly protein LptE/RlpB